MAWIVSDGRVLASVEVARDRRSKGKGLIGKDGYDGAFVIEHCRWIHTIGLRFPLDVAFLDSEGVVLKTMRMHEQRIGIPVWKARTVVEAEAGAFGRWGLHVGDVIELRE